MDYKQLIYNRRVMREQDAVIADALEPFGLTVNQWLMLAYIRDNDGVKPSVIAKAFNTSIAYVTITVAGLVSAGLVRKAGSKEDRRAVELHFTGEQTLGWANDHVQEACGFLNLLTDKDLSK